MNKPVLTFSFLLVILLFITDACVDHDLGPGTIIDCTGSEDVSYLNDIKPIVDANCSRCHNSSFVGKDWTDPAQLQSRADEAKRRVALPTTHPDHMPLDPPELTHEEIHAISCWVQQGAPIDN